MPGFGQLQMPSLTTLQSQTMSTQQVQQAQQAQQIQQAQQAQQAKISATTSTTSELAEQEFFVPLRHIGKVRPTKLQGLVLKNLFYAQNHNKLKVFPG